jgi:hypothetical protein
LESGSGEQLHEIRVAIYVNATEFSSVIQGALIATVRRLESRHYQDNSLAQGPRDVLRGATKLKSDGPEFNVVRAGIPAHDGKKVAIITCRRRVALSTASIRTSATLFPRKRP